MPVMHDKSRQYPHYVYSGESWMSWETKNNIAKRQLEGAIRHFQSQVEKYNNAVGCKSALPVEQKEFILPYLKMLTDCGWPMEQAEAILRSRGYDTKSLGHADTAFKSIASFALEPGVNKTHALHIAMHYIAETLRKAAEAEEAKYSSDQPRVPRGNPDGGEWTEGSGGSGGGGSTSPSAGKLPGGSPAARGNPSKPSAPRPLRTYPRSTNQSSATHVIVHDQKNITIHHADGSTETRVGGSRTWRNNNPGDVIYDKGGFAKRHGAIGENNKFAVFPDAQTGHEANVALMKGPSYAPMTINDAIKKRSPPNENDTRMLQREIPKRAGLSGDLTIGSLKPKEFDSFLEAVYQFEGWGEGTVTKTPPKPRTF